MRIIRLLSCASILALFTAMAALSQETPQFTSRSNLVLLPFNVVNDKLFTTDLTRSDITLFEDGKPREFSIFEGPNTAHRVPVELILLFDTTTLLPRKPGESRGLTHWDRDATYSVLTRDWDDKASKEVLQFPGADIRVSVYRFDFNRLQRLSRSTADPHELRESFARLLTAMSEGDSASLVTLDKKTEATMRGMSVSFPYSASIAVLNDASVDARGALRMLVVFSEGFAEPQGMVQDLVDKANDMGIPLYPVVLNYDKYFQNPRGFLTNSGNGGIPIRGPRDAAGEMNSFNGSTPIMDRFAGLSGMTGGQYFSPSQLDPGIVRRILETVRNEGFSQYVVGFTPEPGSATTRSHKLEVKLTTKAKGKMINGQRQTAY